MRKGFSYTETSMGAGNKMKTRVSEKIAELLARAASGSSNSSDLFSTYWRRDNRLQPLKKTTGDRSLA